MQNTVQSVDVGGISSGGESLIKWCENLVGTGVNNILESGRLCWRAPSVESGAAITT